MKNNQKLKYNKYFIYNQRRSGDDFSFFYAVSFAWQLGFLIAFPIAGFMFVGFISDEYLGTKPLLLFIGVFIAFIISAYEVYHMIVPMIKKQEND